MKNILNYESQIYSVKTNDFEGPLDLLCHLIDKNKMNILDKYTTLLSGLHLNRHIIPYLYNINVYDDRKSIRHSRMGFMSRAEPARGECHPPSLPIPVLRKNNDRLNLSLPAGCALSSKTPRS